MREFEIYGISGQSKQAYVYTHNSGFHKASPKLENYDVILTSIAAVRYLNASRISELHVVSAVTCACACCTDQHFPLPVKNPV